MRKSKIKSENTSIDKDDLGYEEEYEENGLCDFVPGTPVAEFCFDANTVPSSGPMLKELPVKIVSAAPKHDLLDNRTLRPQAFGKTPSINGESFELTRTFVFRRSTVRILNQLKAEDPDENIYLSSIIDNAIRHYANYIFNKNSSQS